MEHPVFDSPPPLKQRARSSQRRPGPAHPHYTIPPEQWPEVRRRVEQEKSLRKVAKEYHTSYQTIWRILHPKHQRKEGGEQ
jgi:DNA invertase Pin-like site-specific DNA recombinase